MSQSVRHLLPVMIARPVLGPQLSQSLLTRQATQHQCTLACVIGQRMSLSASDPRVGAGNQVEKRYV